MTRDQLIGTWKCVETDTIQILNADGTCLLRVYGSADPADEQQAHWEHVDDAHWNLRFVYPPDPTKEWLVNGATEVIEYSIESESPDRMTLSQFDVEYPSEWIKLPTPAAEAACGN